MRVLFLVPLAVYGAGCLAMLMGAGLGYWTLAFHPDQLFPFEMLGLTGCFAGWRLTR